MCGRYGLYHSPKDVIGRFLVQELPGLEEYGARYNAAPTQEMPVVTLENGVRILQGMRWGLVPGWAKDSAIGAKLINARAETLLEKPAFRNAVQRRRCLVPASYFFEWKAIAGGKQPMLIQRRDRLPFAFAGLWEEWKSAEGPRRTYTIITTTPDEVVAPIHSRMPAILLADEEAAWLDPTCKAVDAVSLLRPFPATELEAYPVSRAVGRVGFDCPECMAPAAAAA